MLLDKEEIAKYYERILDKCYDAIIRKRNKNKQ